MGEFNVERKCTRGKEGQVEEGKWERFAARGKCGVEIRQRKGTISSVCV